VQSQKANPLTTLAAHGSEPRSSTPPPRARALSLSDDDVPIALLFVVLLGIACAMPAQADTFYHLRAGRVMWESGRLLDRELFAHVTYGQLHPNHWWLGQLIFYALHALGGPMLLTLVAGACAWWAVFGAWTLTRGSSPEIRLLLLVVLMLSLPEWSVRPQVFSMALMVVAVRLILADRLGWLPPLMILWANVHAVVVLGVGVVSLVAVEALLWSHHRVRRALGMAAACWAAPMVSPLGLHYWPYVLKVVREAHLLGIDEYRSAFSFALEPALLWLVVGALAIVAVRAVPTLAARDRRDRILLMASGALALAALTSIRNVAFFVLIAAPTFARVAAHERRNSRRPAPRIAFGLVGLVMFAVSVATAYRWREGGAALGWRPLAPAAIAAIRACPEPIYNAFGDGGALIWFVPERRVFMDGRTDAYPIEFLLRASGAELRGEYRDLFADYRIRCAVVGSGSRMARLLREDASMELRFADPRWQVFHLAQ
jgi:hypothetical protein